MNTPLNFTLHLDPAAKGRPRFFGGRVVTPDKTSEFERQVRILSLPFRPKAPLSGAIRLGVWFYLKPMQRRVRVYPTVRPDIDNFLKAIMDSCNGVFWNDDAQIIEVTARKYYDTVNRLPRIELTIEEMGVSKVQTTRDLDNHPDSGPL